MDPAGKTTSAVPVPSEERVMAVVEAEPKVKAAAPPGFKIRAAIASVSFAVKVTVPASFLPKVKVASVFASKVSAFSKVKVEERVRPGKVLAPAKVWVPVVTKPRTVAEASGILNVWVVPEEEMLKSAPDDPVANVCVAPDKPPKVVMPLPAAAHSQ